MVYDEYHIKWRGASFAVMLCKLVYAYSTHYVTTSVKVPFHNHSVYECVYYAKGNGTFGTREKTYSYFPGAVIITRPGISHTEIHLSPTQADCFGYVAMHPSADFAEDITVLRIQSGSVASVLAKSVLEEQKINDVYSREMSESLFASFLVQLQRMAQGKNVAAEFINPLDFYQNTFWNPNDDSDITAIWNHYLREYEKYSPDGFRRAFRRRMHMSPTQFQLHLRILKAKSLLSITVMNITDIALSCGFSSSSYFTQQFQKQVKMTPSQYRRDLAYSPNNLIDWEGNKP